MELKTNELLGPITAKYFIEKLKALNHKSIKSTNKNKNRFLEFVSGCKSGNPNAPRIYK